MCDGEGGDTPEWFRSVANGGASAPIRNTSFVRVTVACDESPR